MASLKACRVVSLSQPPFHTAGGAEADSASGMAIRHADQGLCMLDPERMLTQEFCAAGGVEAGAESRASSGSSRPSQDALASAASAKLSGGIGRFRVPDSEGPAAAVRLNSGKRSAWTSEAKLAGMSHSTPDHRAVADVQQAGLTLSKGDAHAPAVYC